jgi:hypothetical protein
MAIPNSSKDLTRSININSLNFLQELAMSKYLINTLKISGSILGLYCSTLAIAPMASAQYKIPFSNPGGATSCTSGACTIPFSNPGGATSCTSGTCTIPFSNPGGADPVKSPTVPTSSGSTNPSTTYSEAASSGVRGSRSSNSGKTGSAAGNSSVGADAATIALVQQFQSQLSTIQSAYENASAKLAQAQVAQAAASKSDPVRYARVMAAECGCMNPDSASNTAGNELAAARAAEAKAAEDLVQAQAAARKFLADAKNRNGLATSGISFSPLW